MGIDKKMLFSLHNFNFLTYHFVSEQFSGFVCVLKGSSEVLDIGRNTVTTLVINSNWFSVVIKLDDPFLLRQFVSQGMRELRLQGHIFLV